MCWKLKLKIIHFDFVSFKDIPLRFLKCKKAYTVNSTAKNMSCVFNGFEYMLAFNNFV